MSDTSSSSRTTSVQDTLVKRRRAQERQSDVMERHRHWSVSGVAGTGAQREGAREAAPRYHGAGTQGYDIDVDFEGDGNRMQVQDGGGERDNDGDAEPDDEAGADQGCTNPKVAL